MYEYKMFWFLVFTIIFILDLVSIIRTSKTNPGKLPNDSEWDLLSLEDSTSEENEMENYVGKE